MPAWRDFRASAPRLMHQQLQSADHDFHDYERDDDQFEPRRSLGVDDVALAESEITVSLRVKTSPRSAVAIEVLASLPPSSDAAAPPRARAKADEKPRAA